MNETSRNFMVGVFVLGSLLVLAVLLAWFGEAPKWLGGNEWTLRIVGVRGLYGIEPGSPVQLNGVQIGRVRNLDFADRSRPDAGVVIFAGIQDEFIVPGEARARVYGATFGFGTGHVDIVVPRDIRMEPLPKKDSPMIEGEMHDAVAEMFPKDLVNKVEQAITNIGEFAAAATPAAEGLAALLEPRPKPPAPGEVPSGEPAPDELANVSTVVQRFDEVLANISNVLGDPQVQTDLREAIREMRNAVADLRKSIEAFGASSERIAQSVETGVGDVREDFDKSFSQLNTVLERLDNSAANLSRTLAYIAEGQGTIGMLVRDPRLYEAAVISLQRFGDAMGSLKVILARIEAEGFIPVGTSSGILRKNVPLRGASEAFP